MLKPLYTNPSASVLTNGHRSSVFNLGRGTRQGCPLSPLIFLLALEPLAIAIRQHKDITGIWAGDREHKLLLYADDILWLSKKPAASVPHLLTITESFSNISG